MYYWTAVNDSTGEMAECGKGYSTEESAYRGAKRFLKESDWTGEVRVEIWSQPHAYSNNLYILPLSSAVYERERVNWERLLQVLAALDNSFEDRNKVIDEYLQDEKTYRKRVAREGNE